MSWTPKRALPTSAVQVNHRHGKPGNSVSSRKREAKLEKKANEFGKTTRPAAFNIKANTQSNYMAKWKNVKKLMDREHRKHHALINKRITKEMVEPPILVAVVGPPGVGKSLLIRSLVKHYTTTKITDCRGPMTILANSTRRITFLEVPNDLNAMVDVAKTCDLALLLVDATYGFEMETFEFLNCAQVHGFPRVMGVLTHLDKYVKLKKKQSIVYHVKHRFWKEIYAGAKLFVLKGVDQRTGLYNKFDVKNLVRLISVLRFRPITWRNSHSYVLVDRYEDLTEPALIHKYGAKKVDRKMAFYGYIRGCNLRQKQNIHICGVGDFQISEIQEMEDPVPTKQTQSANSTLRVLTKSGKVYAPMANLGPVVFDKHAAYITVRSSAATAKKDDLQKKPWETEQAYVRRLKKEAIDEDQSGKLVDIKQGDGEGMVTRLRDRYHDVGIDEKLKQSKLQLFAGGKAMGARDVEKFLIEKKVQEIEGKAHSVNTGKQEVEDDDATEVVRATVAPVVGGAKKKKKKKGKTTGILKRSGKFNVETTKTGDRVRRRVRFDDEVKPGKNGGIQLKDDAMQWVGYDDEDGDDDQELEGDDEVDFNADINAEPELVDMEEVGSSLHREIDSTKTKDGSDAEEDVIGDGTEGTKGAFWNETWLNTPKEIERSREEKEKQRAKAQRQSREASKSTTESNARWKQNLLANASEIWQRTATLAEHIYGKEEVAKSGKRPESAVDSDSDDEFFKIEQPQTVEFREIDDEDSAVTALRKFKVTMDTIYGDKNEDEDDEAEPENVDSFVDDDDEADVKPKQPTYLPEIRHRFVTGDWAEAQKFRTAVERRAHDVNPDLWDEEIQGNRGILEDLGARTEDNKENDFGEETLDWEFKLEQMMKRKGAEGDITMEDKLAFAQSGGAMENEDGDTPIDGEELTTAAGRIVFDARLGLIQQKGGSTLDLEDMARLEAKIKKKEQFDREFDEGLLNFDAAFDKTGVSQEDQRKIFQKKGDLRDTQTRDRSGKLRARGGMGHDDRKNVPGAGKGAYYMDIIREEMAAQNERNIKAFIRESDEMKQELRGFIPGSYVRIVVDQVPAEFDLHFDLEYPIVIGGLLPQEMQFGLIQCRIKKHRWYKRLLKFNDPLIISAGWRRYQSCPLYCVEDRGSSVSNKRLRMIKYTPDHMHCLAVFYGPIIAPNTGFLGYVTSAESIRGFRIAATGNILSSNLTYKIVKKLKLIGEPQEIHRNTVFVKGMFKSKVEVAKFIGAKLQTVSGIRGSIKSAQGPRGNFRATFEDKLLKSDIIFLKSWVPMVPHSLYYEVRNLLLENKNQWKGMRTVGEIRFTTNSQATKAIFKEDSIYNKADDLKRVPLRRFNKLKVPKALEKKLPFRLRPKYDRDLRTKKEKHLEAQNYATKDEKRAQKFIAGLALIAANHNERQAAHKKKQRLKKRKFQKKKQEIERIRKRARIAKHLAKVDKGTGHVLGSQFEATRGNKFHNEWRIRMRQ